MPEPTQDQNELLENRKVSIIEVSNITNRQTAIEGTLPELLVYFKSILKSGAACRGRGTHKINTQPQNLRTLVSSLNKAKRNLTGSRFEPAITYRCKKPGENHTSLQSD